MSVNFQRKGQLPGALFVGFSVLARSNSNMVGRGDCEQTVTYRKHGERTWIGCFPAWNLYASYMPWQFSAFVGSHSPFRLLVHSPAIPSHARQGKWACTWWCDWTCCAGTQWVESWLQGHGFPISAGNWLIWRGRFLDNVIRRFCNQLPCTVPIWQPKFSWCL